MTEEPNKKALAKRLDTIGWGLFFIWVGIAVLWDVGWGIGLMGVGILALVEQLARQRLGLQIEWFWVIAGSFLLLAGGWEFIEDHQSAAAIALILIGLLISASAFRGNKTNNREQAT